MDFEEWNRTGREMNMPNKALGVMVAVAVSAAAWSSTPVLAQGYPDRPITLVVPYAPGGATDLLGRLLAQKMSESMGQKVMVENRSGAGGTIGSSFVARAAPDGYTFGLGTIASHVMVKFTSKTQPYDPVKDFTPLVLAGEMSVVLAVHSSVPANNTREFVEYVKKNPGKVSFGSPGTGGTHHFAGELLKQMTGIDMVHVPYKGTGQAMQDLVAGQIPAQFTSLAAAIPQGRAGKIKLLGLIEAKRQPRTPDIPTIGESIPGYVMPPAWNGFFGPAGLPAPIAKRLTAELVKALYTPETRAKIEAAGMTVTSTSGDEFGAIVKDHIEMYRKITTAMGYRPE